MRALGWRVSAVCTQCRTRLWVDLDHLAVLAGPDALMWGRAARCRVWTWGDHDRCPGVVVFEAQSIRGGSFKPLAMTAQVRELWWTRQHPGQDPVQAHFDAANAHDAALKARRDEDRQSR